MYDIERSVLSESVRITIPGWKNKTMDIQFVKQQHPDTKIIWLNEAIRVVSFHFQKGFTKKEFKNHEEMIRFVVDLMMDGYSAM